MLKAQILNKKFENCLSKIFHINHIDVDVFAVGVSGGADSLALVYLLNNWAEKNKKRLVTLTVDHGLRPESMEEANYVSSLMKNINVEHHILHWGGEKPTNGVEEAARIARYNLLETFCVDNDIKYLMIAHHKMDQAETFLMRLQRGSGVDGLSSMSEVTDLNQLKIVRPLLDFYPNELKEYLQEMKIEWKEDSFNYNEDFLRVKIRNIIPYLDEKIGLSIDRIANTAKVLGRTRDYLEKQVNGFIKNNVKFVNKKVVKVSLNLLVNQHEEMLFRIVSFLIKEIADRAYIPRAGDVQRLCDAIIEDGINFKSRTLGGCEILNYDKSIWIIPELKSSNLLTKKEWEDFLLSNSEYRKMKLPYKVRRIIKNLKSVEF